MASHADSEYKSRGYSRANGPVHDLYKDSLDNVVDSNIDDRVASTTNTNPYPLMPIISATQPKTPFDILLPLGLFCETASSRDKNSSLSAKGSSSPTLSPSIVPRKLSNPLLKPSGNYSKLRKG